MFCICLRVGMLQSRLWCKLYSNMQCECNGCCLVREGKLLLLYRSVCMVKNCWIRPFYPKRVVRDATCCSAVFVVIQQNGWHTDNRTADMQTTELLTCRQWKCWHADNGTADVQTTDLLRYSQQTCWRTDNRPADVHTTELLTYTQQNCWHTNTTELLTYISITQYSV
jgi:hypothetical protein